MFESVQAYNDAVAATGVFPVEFTRMGQLYPQFEERAHYAFEQFMTSQKRSVRFTSWEGQFSSYVNRESRGMWVCVD